MKKFNCTSKIKGAKHSSIEQVKIEFWKKSQMKIYVLIQTLSHINMLNYSCWKKSHYHFFFQFHLIYFLCLELKVGSFQMVLACPVFEIWLISIKYTPCCLLKRKVCILLFFCKVLFCISYSSLKKVLLAANRLKNCC